MVNGRLIAFNAIEARLQEHYHVTAGPFLPEGEERRLWVSSMKLRYRNARRRMFARAMSEHITRASNRISRPRVRSTTCSGWLSIMLLGKWDFFQNPDDNWILFIKRLVAKP
jgi:hypothetical protein